MPTESRPSAAVEDYLKELFRLQLGQRGGDGVVPTGELAAGLGVAPPSVTAMVRRLHKQGLLEHIPYKGAKLTDEGQKVASLVLRRHRLIETFLNQALGLDWSEVHDEAEALEHAVSDLLLNRMDEFLGHPATDPHGDPIPGPDGTFRQRHTHPLAECKPGDQVRIATVRGHDREFFRFLTDNGLALGTLVTVEPSHPAAGVILLRAADAPTAVALAISQGHRVLVEAV